ncbi:MAG: hypothetical protein V4556_00040 [Bacteroidota bacterium]
MEQIDNEIFDLEFGVNTIRVERLEIPGQTFFRVNFSNKIPTLNLLRATNSQNEKFWTSVPEGRLVLAQQIGLLIEQYYRSKK